MEITSKIENRTLFITLKGKGSDLEGVKKFSKEMFERCLKNSCNKILLEYGVENLNLTDVELFELGEYHAHIIPSIIRVAVVRDDYTERLKLWEDVCVNRGANVKVFTDYESAGEWLNHAV